MTERVRVSNVNWTHDMPQLSPTKERFDKICLYTSQHYSSENNAKHKSEVRRIVNDTNRKFRL